ncbi:MAG: bifunctional nuclease family protein [Bacteroidales bacterium]|nr:bifunctional nuclease family protein [Candidatus Colimorpha onthohippi]
MSYLQVKPIEIIPGLSESDSYVLLLQEPQSGKCLPILIGLQEVQSILVAKEQIELPRPNTHRLTLNIMETFGLTIKGIRTEQLLEGVFYAHIVVTDGFNDKIIDSRTSDAVALAYATNSQIWAKHTVIEEAGCDATALIGNLPHHETNDDATATSPTPTLSELEIMLQQCEEREDYEQAAEIQAQIDRIKQGDINK